MISVPDFHVLLDMTKALHEHLSPYDAVCNDKAENPRKFITFI